MKQQLASEVQKVTLELRNNQKLVFHKMQGAKEKDQTKDFEINENQINMILEEQDGCNMDDLMYELAVEKNEQINDLVNSINELSHTFKQLNALVIEQGTLLDRIDCNLEETHENVLKANVHLRKVSDGSFDSGRGRGASSTRRKPVLV